MSEKNGLETAAGVPQHGCTALAHLSSFARPEPFMSAVVRQGLRTLIEAGAGMQAVQVTARASVAAAWKKEGGWEKRNTHRKPREIAVLFSRVDGWRRLQSDVCTYIRKTTPRLRGGGTVRAPRAASHEAQKRKNPNDTEGCQADRAL